MKNAMLKVSVTFIVVIIAIFAGLMYASANQETDKTSVIEQEIMYMDSKLTMLVNLMNNIELQNYQVAVTKIEEEESETSSKEQEKTQEKQSEEDSGENSEENKQESQLSRMEQALISVDEGETNWEMIQGEAEVFYSSWATIVLNLNDIGVSNEKILEYSNYQDEAIIGIKNKDKQKALENLSNAYSLLYDFMQNTEIEDTKKEAIRAKGCIISSYANVEKDDWEEVQNQVGNAEVIFVNLVNDAEKLKEPQKFNINKTYILIGELKNSLNLKDKEIFFIKYKNILEEMNTFI